jgi:nucleoside-diphosphate-sugar epimerase
MGRGMDPTRILILGGTGNTGRPLAELLLRESDVQDRLAAMFIAMKKNGLLYAPQNSSSG